MAQKDAAVSLREGRTQYGWSVELAAEIYGRYARGKAVTAGAMYTIEEGCMPKDAKRRWILARMYNLAPAIFGLEIMQRDRKIPARANGRRSRPVDVREYQATLLSYWKNGYNGTPESALADLGMRINSLHDSAFYSPEQEQMKRLLCGYHRQRAEVARELGYDAGALSHYNKAVILATENNYSDLSAAALYRRGEFYFDRWELKKALRDFNQAEISSQITNPYPTPPDVLGRVRVVKGVTLARMAQSEQDMVLAMKATELSKNLVRSEQQEPLCLIDFSQANYNKNYIRALLGPPLTKLHRPNEADALMEGISRKLTSARFQAYEQLEEKLLTALIYVDKGYHEAATTLLQDALKVITQGYMLYVPVVERGYELLLASPYGKSQEVAELGLQLLGVQMAQVLNVATKW